MEKSPAPTSFAVGDQLDWDSPLLSVLLTVELPFWLMMEPATVAIQWGSAQFELLVGDADSEVFLNSFMDSRANCGYQGPRPESFENRDDIKSLPDARLFRQKQRTVVYFKTRCLQDVLESFTPNNDKLHVARSYLETLCEAHIPVLNELIRRYRILTYDYFAYEVAAWDVPIWHLRQGPPGHVSVPLFTYAALSGRPRIFPHLFEHGVDEDTRQENYQLSLTSGDAIEHFDHRVGVPGEDDLLDARNLMERGDYNGAVRRTTTAIEALVEHVLEIELTKLHDAATVQSKLDASKNDFPGRLRQWQKLTGVALSVSLLAELETTRQLRHEIVHRGRRVAYEERGTAQRAVDTGRWIFNHIERDEGRRDLRERNNVIRAIARPTLAFRFPVDSTPDGFVVSSLRSQW